MEENRFKKLRMELNPNDMEEYKAKDLSKDLGIARNRDRYIYGAQMAHTIYNVKHLFEIMRGIYLQ